MFIAGAKCDKCGILNYAQTIHSKKVITSALRSAGWSVGKRTICPNCKPKRKKRDVLIGGDYYTYY
jgi:hypothetical protein